MDIEPCSEDTKINGTETVINIVMFGPSKTGKSTLINTIKNPEEGIKHVGFSDISKACINICKIKVFNRQTGIHYLLNIIDTPEIEAYLQMGNIDFRELNKKPFNIKFINAICFTTKAGYTHSEDKDKIVQFIKYLPVEFSDISMLILTHCDKFARKKIDEFEKAIKDDQQTKQFYSFCKQGIFHMGALDLDDIESHENLEAEQRLRANKLKNIEKYRKLLIEKFIECSNEPPMNINFSDNAQSIQTTSCHEETNTTEKIRHGESNTAENIRHGESNTVRNIRTEQHKKCWKKLCCFSSWCVSFFSSAAIFFTISGIIFIIIDYQSKRLVTAMYFMDNLILNNEYSYSEIVLYENFSAQTCYRR